MILVVGSGFGLYGHAAALATAGREVAMPARYRTFAAGRPELAQLIDAIQWVVDEEAAVADAQLVCLARRPADNVAFVERVLGRGPGPILVLEKPVAPTWREAMSLATALSAADRRWYTPYLFLFCDWFALIASLLARGKQIAVRWQHRQSSSVRPWKLNAAEGGSAINFYFIHCLALLQALLPRAAAHHTIAPPDGEIGRIELVASDASARLNIAFELGERFGFEVAADDRIVYEARTPFGAVPEPGQPDPRIPALQRFYGSILDGHGRYDGVDFQMAVTQRWRDICDA